MPTEETDEVKAFVMDEDGTLHPIGFTTSFPNPYELTPDEYEVLEEG